MVKTKEEYLEKLNKILLTHQLSIKAQKESDHDIKLLIEDTDLNQLIVIIKQNQEFSELQVNNKKSPIFHKIYKDIIMLQKNAEVFLSRYIGTDESGKGDYFGPLVVAGFISDEETNIELSCMGVQDSKKLSDNKIMQLEQSIKSRFPDRYSILSFEPEKYNQIYSIFKLDGKNLNYLLGWAHSEVINTLLHSAVAVNGVLIDKFADDECIIDTIRKYDNNLEIINQPRINRFRQ